MKGLNVKGLQTEFDALKLEQQAEVESFDPSTADEAAKSAAMKSMGDRASKMQEIKEQLDSAKSILGSIAPENGGAASAPAIENGEAIKSFGTQFVEQTSLKNLQLGVVKSASMTKDVRGFRALKALNSSSNMGITDTVQRRPGFESAGPIEDLRIADLFSQGEVDKPSMLATVEILPVNTVTTVAEGAKKPEVNFTFEDRNFKRSKIAGIARLTDEQLMDHAYLRSYVEGRLGDLVKDRENDKIVNATGLGADFVGILATEGIQVHEYETADVEAAGGLQDEVFKSMTKTRIFGKASADGILLNPYDWEKYQLSKDANGQYRAGGPSYAPYGNGLYQVVGTMWGKPVITTEYIAQGEFIVGAFKVAGQVLFGNGATVSIDSTNSNKDDFENNITTIRGEEFVMLVIIRPSALVHGKAAA